MRIHLCTARIRKSDLIQHHHNHHPEGVVYRSFRLNSSAFAASEMASRRWCVESLFPLVLHEDAHHARRRLGSRSLHAPGPRLQECAQIKRLNNNYYYYYYYCYYYYYY